MSIYISLEEERQKREEGEEIQPFDVEAGRVGQKTICR